MGKSAPRRSAPAKALVTGAAGFIGSHLCEELLDRGFNVVALDDLSTGRISHIAHLRSRKSFRFIKADVRDRRRLDALVRGCDIVFHLAAAVGVRYILRNTLETLDINVEGGRAVMDSCAVHGRRLVLASSSEVYGKHPHAPIKETDDRRLGPTRVPRWSYAESKAIDECYAFAYARERGLPVVIARLFNVVGPRQTGRYGMVVPRFIRCALEGRRIPVYGSGRQVRSFIHVKDAARLMAELSLVKKAYGRAFNVGNPEPVSISRLASLIKRKTGSVSRITYRPYEAYYGDEFEDVPYRVPDIALLRRFVRFKRLRPLPDILKDSIDHLKNGGSP